MEEALQMADKNGLVIASNQRLSQAFFVNDEWRKIKDAFTCWSGTMVAYDKPDMRLGKYIEYLDTYTCITYMFPVPQQFQGRTNLLLLAEHPNFTLETDGHKRIVRATEVEAVSDFPAASGNWYLGHHAFDIPVGRRVESSHPQARHLFRYEKMVGLIERGANHNTNGGKSIVLSSSPSCENGVVVEASLDSLDQPAADDMAEAPKPAPAGSGPVVIELRNISAGDFDELMARSAESLQALRTIANEGLLEPLESLVSRITGAMMRK